MPEIKKFDISTCTKLPEVKKSGQYNDNNSYTYNHLKLVLLTAFNIANTTYEKYFADNAKQTKFY